VTAINYLFPPDQIDNLPTWRFVLHFIVPESFGDADIARAKDRLRNAEWKIIQFPFGIDNLAVSSQSKSLDVPIEVTQERRGRPNALADYESDVWKIFGNLAQCGVGDLYYEAIDWQDGQSKV
jgi:hypothetical protein